MDRNSNEWKILGVLGKLYLEHAREELGYTGLRSIRSRLEFKGVSLGLGDIQLAINELASCDFVIFDDFRGTVAISNDGIAFWKENKNSNKATFDLKPKTEKKHIIKKMWPCTISPIKRLFSKNWQKIKHGFNRFFAIFTIISIIITTAAASIPLLKYFGFIDP